MEINIFLNGLIAIALLCPVCTLWRLTFLRYLINVLVTFILFSVLFPLESHARSKCPNFLLFMHVLPLAGHFPASSFVPLIACVVVSFVEARIAYSCLAVALLCFHYIQGWCKILRSMLIRGIFTPKNSIKNRKKMANCVQCIKLKNDKLFVQIMH